MKSIFTINKKLTFSVILLLFLFVIILIFSNSSAIAFSFFFFLSIGGLIISLIGLNKSNKIRLCKLFLFITPFYLLYAFIAYLGYCYLGDFYLFPDQGYFYENSNLLAKSNSIRQIYILCFVDNIHYETEGAFFLFGSIGYFANKFFDGNSVLLQIIFTSFFAIYSSLYLFQVISSQVKESKAFKYTLNFALFSPLFFYSPWLLRDVHIGLLYLVGFYLIYRKFNALNFLYFYIVFAILIQFRPGHGLFFLTFPIVHLIINKNKSKFIKSFLPLVILASVFIFAFVFYKRFDEIMYSVDEYNKYSKYTEGKLNSGFGAKLYGLPTGVKQLALIINSQITPLPPWVNISFTSNFFIVIVGFISMITAVYWSRISIFIMLSLTRLKRLFLLPFNLRILLILGIVFLLLNTSNIDVRRIMAIYPIFFLCYISLNESELIISGIKKNRKNSLIIYVTLLLLYVIFKIF